jgi:hypothetical protein
MRAVQLPLVLAAFLGVTLARAQAQFIELAADIEIVSWDRSYYDPPSFDSALCKVRCIVGTNSWMITASNNGAAPETWYYSGSNLVRQFPTGNPSQPATRSVEFNGDPESLQNAEMNSPSVRIPWLAFCSGPFLSRPHREVPLPGVFWKQSPLYFDHQTAPVGFPDQTMQFEDELALPFNIEVTTKAGQPLFQYHVKHGRGPHVLSTNLLGCDFPLEFGAVQYSPLDGAKDKWQANLIAHGKLTSIKVGAPPKLTSTAAAPQLQGRPKAPKDAADEFDLRSKTNYSYVLKAGGPVSYNVLTTPPELNKARISLRRLEYTPNRVFFTVTNAEPDEILIWNVGVQVKSPAESPGTDGFGWDTVYDDFPNSPEAALKPNHSTELFVTPPSASIWRVCVLYAKEQKDKPGPKTYAGDHEIISVPIDDAILDTLFP